MSPFIINASEPISDMNPDTQAARIPQYQQTLKSVFSEANKFEEIKIEPSKSGGFTLMGLISRLMGTATNPQFEGMGVSRYIYTAHKNDRFLGVAHASMVEMGGMPVKVLVHYDADGNVKNIGVENAPTNVLAELKSGNYIGQLNGYSTEDFQTTYERKRRKTISHSGKALKEIKYPATSTAREYFSKIVRSLKFNVAFVDVAYFISRLPMLDMQSRRITSVARGAGSPESQVEGAQVMSPSSDRSRTMILKNP